VSGEVFIDWITAHQQHPGGGLPVVFQTLDVKYSREGVALRERACPSVVQGSFDSAIRVGCNGFRVYLSGNVGRFGREDNLFNYRWAGTRAAANRILLDLGLPPFSAGGVSENGDVTRGARVSRLDVTANFAAGSEAQGHAVIRWLASQSVRRAKRGQAGNESVWWANTRKMFKAYLKGPELEAHGMSPDEFQAAWCRRVGLVRVEVEVKKRLLCELGLDDWGGITDEKLEACYHDQTALLRKVDRSDEPDILAGIPARYRMTAAAWLAGQDVRSLLGQASLYRHARVLREYDLDILQYRNVEALRVKVRVVDLQPLAVPDWYQPFLKVVNS